MDFSQILGNENDEDAPLNLLSAEMQAAIEELRSETRTAAQASRALSTERAYAADWRDFCAFAYRIGHDRLPAHAETAALYITDLKRRGRRPATIARKLAAIAVYHRSSGFHSPTEHDIVRAVLRGTRRRLGIAQRQKTALEIRSFLLILSEIPNNLRGKRDRALLLVGWAAALRRSELVRLTIEDVTFESEGMVLNVRRSKTDVERSGEVVAVPTGMNFPTCPVVALTNWLEAAQIREGYIFRRIDRHGNLGPMLSDRTIGTIVARLAEAAGLDGDFAGHSLRAGFATTAAQAGRSEAAIMRHGRWKSVQVARRYMRQGTRWNDNAAADLGL